MPYNATYLHKGRKNMMKYKPKYLSFTKIKNKAYIIVRWDWIGGVGWSYNM